MHKILMAAAISAAFAQACTTMPDSSPTSASATPGYVASVMEGKIVKTTGGECLRSVGWSSDNIVVECAASAKAAPTATAPTPKLARLSFDGKALFAFDSSELTSLGRRELNGLVSKLKSHGGIGSIAVVGHADSIGDSSYNQTLSEQRAGTVRSYLESTLSNVKVQDKGMGETAPVADNSTPTGRQRNRRVEVNVDAMVAQ